MGPSTNSWAWAQASTNSPPLPPSARVSFRKKKWGSKRVAAGVPCKKARVWASFIICSSELRRPLPFSVRNSTVRSMASLEKNCTLKANSNLSFEELRSSLATPVTTIGPVTEKSNTWDVASRSSTERVASRLLTPWKSSSLMASTSAFMPVMLGMPTIVGFSRCSNSTSVSSSGSSRLSVGVSQVILWSYDIESEEEFSRSLLALAPPLPDMVVTVASSELRSFLVAAS
mmetsp:Transcript_20931/g.66770  ORF Transcript_20931/g.66770 Transcript_20931/m.66770 type:complete len:230 (-) Transcript_20931:373-1062(-)